jgi:hypothetical protein
MAPRAWDWLTVPFEASNFQKDSPLNGLHSLNARWDDLLWASITVGKAQPDLMRFGRYSFAEILHRVACLHAYYDIDNSNRVALSPAYKNLDSTEKGVVSYYTGMAMAKLYADKVLGIPWMMHISRYEADWAVRYGANSNRPDLFGCNYLGEWAVAEAKGRARVTSKLVTKMQQQKSAVASIQRVAPTYRYGSATRFEGGRLALRVVDPARLRRAQDVPIDPAAWLLDYYRPIVDLLDQTDAHYEGEAIVGILPGTDIEIGVSGTIAEVVHGSRGRPLQRPGPRPVQVVDHEEGRRSLGEQTEDDELRVVVERLVVSAREVASLEGATNDGLIVRSARG